MNTGRLDNGEVVLSLILRHYVEGRHIDAADLHIAEARQLLDELESGELTLRHCSEGDVEQPTTLLMRAGHLAWDLLIVAVAVWVVLQVVGL